MHFYAETYDNNYCIYNAWSKFPRRKEGSIHKKKVARKKKSSKSEINTRQMFKKKLHCGIFAS